MMLLHDQQPMPPVISLRSNGDIINLLPLLKFVSDKRGKPVQLVVHPKFAGVLDGVSYVKPIIWAGDMEDPIAAESLYHGINAQVVGRGLVPDLNHDDYAKVAWAKLGYPWTRHRPLVFDQRNFGSEEKLAKSVFKTDLPKVLVKMHSFSSPFSDADQIRKLVNDEFGSFAEVVNLDDVKACRVYDLIGLLDRASCLISADTVTLWLAKASKCPVISLVNPIRFLASPPTGNVLLRVPYTQAVSGWDSIARVIHATLFQLGTDNKIVLVFNDFKTTDRNTQKRQQAARKTWNNLPCRMCPFPAKRTSLNLGDKFVSPFVRDMIQGAMGTGDEGIIAITNTDIQFGPMLHREVVKACKEFGCYWSYRLVGPHKTDHGVDFFAFTRAWWFQRQHLYPDLLLGYYWWDDLMVRMMRWCGCTERPRAYSHEPHGGSSAERQLTPGGLHNHRLGLAWLTEHHELNQKPD
jgi:hypothetical protein